MNKWLKSHIWQIVATFLVVLCVTASTLAGTLYAQNQHYRATVNANDTSAVAVLPSDPADLPSLSVRLAMTNYVVTTLHSGKDSTSFATPEEHLEFLYWLCTTTNESLATTVTAFTGLCAGYGSYGDSEFLEALKIPSNHGSLAEITAPELDRILDFVGNVEELRSQLLDLMHAAFFDSNTTVELVDVYDFKTYHNEGTYYMFYDARCAETMTSSDIGLVEMPVFLNEEPLLKVTLHLEDGVEDVAYFSPELGYAPVFHLHQSSQAPLYAGFLRPQRMDERIILACKTA